MGFYRVSDNYKGTGILLYHLHQLLFLKNCKYDKQFDTERELKTVEPFHVLFLHNFCITEFSDNFPSNIDYLQSHHCDFR